MSANTSPAARPARAPASRLPTRATQAAAAAMASTDSVRMASAESPKAAIQPCSSR
ncbi:MAG: hypothetical protein ABSB59_00520 [Streptosporangiaceae bacterium]